MSSAPIPVAAASPPPAPATHWCDECEMSVTLSSSDLQCPHCRSIFIQHLVAPSNQPISISSDSDDDFSFDDYHHVAPPTNPNPNSSSRNTTNPTPTAYLELLIQHLTGDDDPIAPSLLPLNRRRHRGPCPASKSCIESIPTVEISDPTLVCAICTDEFFIGSSARKLPCSHVYHSDCIVPWISSHNSCPLCRFRLPREEGHEGERRGIPRSFTFGRRNVGRFSRPHRMLLPEWEWQMTETEGNVGPTISGETVASEQPPAVADGGDSAVAGPGVQDRMEE